MDWLTPTIFIQILIAVIMASVAWQIRFMTNSLTKGLDDIKQDFNTFNSRFIEHVSDHEIHTRG